MTRIFEPGEKTRRDENFPVASYLIRKKYRSAILAFYRFARAADDVADHPALSEAEKLSRLDAFEATLLSIDDAVAAALPLRMIIAERRLSTRHALDLLIAFRQDACKPRYENWNELMRYCRYSAAPVGRFVLDVHGEDPSAWPASDALCAALQVINHLQDCKADYLRLNRIYLPRELLSRHGVREADLAALRASKALRLCLDELVHKTHGILIQRPLSMAIRDGRLRLEVAAIERLADELLRLLLVRDPLSEAVHLSRSRIALTAVKAALAIAGIAGRKTLIAVGDNHACTGRIASAAEKASRR